MTIGKIPAFNFADTVSFQVISISHQKLNTEDLEKFVIKSKDDEHLKSTLDKIKATFKFDELLYLSTCNRLTILVFREKSLSFPEIREVLSSMNSENTLQLGHSLEKIVEHKIGVECIRLVFEIASSLQSMVIGEREIFRQFRSAYKKCQAFGLTGDNLRLLERYTVETAKDIYTSTKIGEKPVSIVSLALQRLLKLEPEKYSRILMIGSGETNTTFGKFLKKHQFNNIVIFNRSINNARELSQILNAKAYHLTDLEDYNGGFDIIICCTAHTMPIINASNYRNLLNGESDHKILIDLSIPNNISKGVSIREDVTYINIDSLRPLAQSNILSRQGNIAASRILINYHLDNFAVTYEQRQIEKKFKKLPSAIKSIKERALEEVFKSKILKLPQESQDLVREIMDYMEKKCVAAPIKMAKEVVEK